MKFRLFASTFLLVFLAELGDKTQLSALAFSATSEKWSVFVAASLALALSTLLAVLFGNTLTRLVPPKQIHLVSGILFIAFALWVFYEAFNIGSTAVETPQARGVIGIFGLVFLAELGDKTQLTAMARSAGGNQWLVFFAATGALVLSTLLAVLFGDLLQTWLNPSYIRIASGTLFIGFGGWILYHAIAPAPADEPRATIPTDGLLVRVALQIAVQFERAAAEDYRKLATQCTDPNLRDLLYTLEKEEQGHLEDIERGDFLEHAESKISTGSELPSSHELTHDVANDTEPLLEHAVQHENASAKFYQALAQTVIIPSLKNLFQALADQELEHARRLQQFADTREAPEQPATTPRD